MKLKLMTKVGLLTLCSKPEKQREHMFL